MESSFVFMEKGTKDYVLTKGKRKRYYSRT